MANMITHQGNEKDSHKKKLVFTCYHLKKTKICEANVILN